MAYQKMKHRTDKFVVGDRVTWINDDYATLTDGRKRYGDGPFTIASIDPVNSKYYEDAGHTQHLHFKEGEFEILSRFSGAFFKKVD